MVAAGGTPPRRRPPGASGRSSSPPPAARVAPPPPCAAVAAPPPFTYTLSFTVAWGPLPGTTDVATYRIEVNDDGGGWTVWIASTSSTSALYAGAPGHPE